MRGPTKLTLGIEQRGEAWHALAVWFYGDGSEESRMESPPFATQDDATAEVGRMAEHLEAVGYGTRRQS